MDLLKSPKGFAIIMILSLIPILSSGLLLTFWSFSIFEKDMALKHVCRSNGIQGQKKIAPYLTKLMKLNSQARQLRLMKAHAIAHIAANPNPSAKITAQIRLQKIISRQEVLDIRQKQIIAQSNLALLFHFQESKSKLAGLLKQFESSFIFVFRGLAVLGTPPKLAVIADDPGLAPIYSLHPNFTEVQALAHEWHYKLSVVNPQNSETLTELRMKKSCSVTLKKEGEVWLPQIKMDKSSLKSAW